MYTKEPVEVATDKIRIYNVEIPKFTAEYNSIESVNGKNSLYQWLYVLTKGYQSEEEDVKGGDKQGRKYNLEMEKNDARLERAEFHVATMVVEHLHEGDDFSDLPESYVIFMCEHNKVGNGRAVNCFRTETMKHRDGTQTRQ